LIPLENPLEHGGDRTAYTRLLAEHYREPYTAVFGPLPDLADTARFPLHASPQGSGAVLDAWYGMSDADRTAVNRAFANIGKALAAYQRTLQPAPARFDAYVAAAQRNDRGAMRESFTPDEEAGLRLFLGKGKCIDCHNGPRFTNDEFHNTAIPGVPGLPLAPGRSEGARRLQADPFNCAGPYSDAAPEECAALRFLKASGDTLEGAHKTPTLRNVAATAPYMHTGQFPDLISVLAHYNGGGLALVGHNELEPLQLTPTEMQQVAAFLQTLTQE
jgi:cytochrome c peroxidase